MGSPLMQLRLTSMTLQGRCQGHSDFELTSRKGTDLVLLLNIILGLSMYGETSDTIICDLA